MCGTIFLYTACESKSSRANVCSADGLYTGYCTLWQKRIGGGVLRTKASVTNEATEQAGTTTKPAHWFHKGKDGMTG